MLNKKQLQQSKTEGDKNDFNHKCETIDKQIDELVYQPACAKPDYAKRLVQVVRFACPHEVIRRRGIGRLYGLTEEEIKIVEGSVK
jgi:hypothetical protein